MTIVFLNDISPLSSPLLSSSTLFNLHSSFLFISYISITFPSFPFLSSQSSYIKKILFYIFLFTSAYFCFFFHQTFNLLSSEVPTLLSSLLVYSTLLQLLLKYPLRLRVDILSSNPHLMTISNIHKHLRIIKCPYPLEPNDPGWLLPLDPVVPSARTPVSSPALTDNNST